MAKEDQSLSSRQLQAIRTRKKLIEAGRTVFLENGFQKSTIAQINRKAKTGYGTAYVYFRNKDELFIELMEDVIQRLYDVAEMPFFPATRREAYETIKNQVRLFLQAALDEQAVMRVVKEAIGVSDAVEERWNDIRQRFIRKIEKDIQYVQEAGIARTELPSYLTAKSWYYINEQLMWDLVAGEGSEDIEEVVQTLTELYTGGLYKPEV